MKNFLYKFEFFSGYYEQIFYKQINAENEREAIIGIVAFFQNIPIDEVNVYIATIISENKDDDTINNNNWTVKDFYDHVEWKFSDFTEGYDLEWIKEINFDLDVV